jgi:UDP-N-acetylglucosamine--N-acetylmuramyl-(pentapeptide) pyrophosphoryl-undecaprenol N-acetylglucosamine transferase
VNLHVACGGTGGHIFPGLATAEELQRRGHEVTLWLAGKDVESQALHGWKGRIITVPAQGLGGNPLRMAKSVWSLFRARRICSARMRTEKPDALLAMGSYASVGPVRAASRLGVPVVLHEANVIPGRAISFCLSRATTVAAAFEETRYYLRRRKLAVTGMPLRRALVEAAREPRAPRGAEDPFTVLVMGGSRGARVLNQKVVEAAEIVSRTGGFRILHLTGPKLEAETRSLYEQAGVRAEITGFCPDMESVYRRADLVLCRSGASTCAELALYGLPSLLIPYPHAARNHQAANARALEKIGAADVVLEEDLEPGWLAEYLAGMRAAPERLDRMSLACRRIARGDAAEALATEVEQAARSRMPGG